MDKKCRDIFKKIEEINNIYRIQANVGIRCISIVIIHESNEQLKIYKTSMILEQNLKEQAEKLSLNVDDYFEKLVSFFEGSHNVKFQISEHSFTIIENVNILQVKYFYSNLERISNCHIGSLIDDLQSGKLQSEIECKQLKLENEYLQKDLVEYKKKLNELVDRKIIDEQSMLSKFVLLLNEKKRRIQHLNELLEAFRNNPALADPVEVNVHHKKKGKSRKTTIKELPQKKEEVSDSNSEPSQENTTDEEILTEQTRAEDTSIRYNDIFEESPTEEDSSILKFSKSNTSETFINALPSTSRGIGSNLETNIKEEYKSPKSSPGYDMKNIDTQEFIDNL